MTNIIIENTKVYNILDALRGMRNPLNSWARNDSKCLCDKSDGSVKSFEIGPNDSDLCQRLINAGTEHRKFLRQIFVSADLTIPVYLTNEFDTYKVNTTRNSCSLQHKGSSRDFTIDDFMLDDDESLKENFDILLKIINDYRRKFVETKDYKYFRLMRQFLPMSYMYKFTWTANYEILLNIYKQRKNHKLKEWHVICDWIKTLPVMNVFLCEQYS